MSHAVAVLITVILMAIVGEVSSEAALRRSVEAGYVIVDKRAYRMVPAEAQP